VWGELQASYVEACAQWVDDFLRYRLSEHNDNPPYPRPFGHSILDPCKWAQHRGYGFFLTFVVGCGGIVGAMLGHHDKNKKT
jgi:hypothetical protein